MSDEKKILLVGGGTGGHVVPIFELYNKLKAETNFKIKIVGGNSEIDEKIFKDNPDYTPLDTGKLHRRLTLKNISEISKFITVLPKSRKIVQEFQPDLIFSKGGYVSAPIIYWAKKFKIPYFIHESDIHIGSANKYAIAKSKKAFVGFPINNYSSKWRGKLTFAGQFISSDFSSGARDQLFNNNKKTLFVTGGSQGATAINEVIFEGLIALLSSYNVIHQTGFKDITKAIQIKNNLSEDLKKNYFIKDFFGHENGDGGIKNAFLNSDIFIGRASVTFPAEATSFSKPLILVPYPYASNNHQLKNARLLAKEGACVLIEQSNLTPEILKSEVDSLIAEPEKCDKMVKNAREVFGKNALDLIYKEIISELKD